MVPRMNDNDRRIWEQLGCRVEELEEIEIDIEIDFGPENRLILLLLGALHRKVDRLMANVEGLEAAVDALAAAEGAAVAELTALKDEVAQLTAGEITQEQIDGITSKVTDVATALASAAAPPAPPEGGGEVPPAEGGEPPAGEPPVGETPPAEGTPPEGETPAEGAPPA
jgi:hypothetical protein